MTSSTALSNDARTDVTCSLMAERSQAAVAAAPFHRWTMADGTPWTLFYRLGTSGYLLRFPDLADFEVSADGHEVQGWPSPGITSRATMEHLYLNQVLPLALSLQGKLLLHGSAVEIGERAVAFIGESGRGKSTLAASFAKAGHRFLTDDGLELRWDADTLIALPSHPSVRLWEDSQERLAGEDSNMAPPVTFTNKARFLAGPGLQHCDQPRRLTRVYFLGDGTAPAPVIEPLRLSSAVVMELVRNSFLLDIGEQAMLARHFEDISRIASMPIYFLLDYPRSFDDLPRVCRAVIEHTNQESH